MARLKKFPKVSCLLLIATYGVFGWLYGDWIVELTNKEQLWHKWFIPSIALGISYGIGLLLIAIVVLFFTAPITLLTLGMDSWFKLDSKAIIAIAISIAICIIIVEHPVVLSRFLILSAAATLFRFDLQTAGYQYTRARWILIFVGAFSFMIGVLLVNFWESSDI
jgi:hypothetical protein